jgi:glutamate formiminotransferase/formiminotetrahydrofolate cyclodeaminase
VSPIHEVFDAIEELAHASGLRVTGSEIVGLVPLNAMVAAGRHYLQKQGESTGVPEARLIEVAIQSLGLSEITPFDPTEKIIEHRTRPRARLASMDLGEFTRELASDSPAPGGGSVAALCGALSASLSAMVAHLTYGKKGYEEKREAMNRIAEAGQSHRAYFVDAVDRDTEAFDAIIAARRMPRSTDEETAARARAMVEANHEATRVPLRVLERTLPTLEIALKVAREGNPNSLSDAGVAGLTALAAAEGAYYNVLINLAGEEDEAFSTETRTAADGALERARALAGELREHTLTRLRSE